ncbi:hypothetical protein B296_00057775 [Ensete ventricosum]|uniref:Uncharacterized protein n=1 Tax=Ensete ventricosum TaxID=4639 RepID=A0A426XQ10_ENSVE|nr:hypothetical protein B296_00057775 [Ensete ventricosum]
MRFLVLLLEDEASPRSRAGSRGVALFPCGKMHGTVRWLAVRVPVSFRTGTGKDPYRPVRTGPVADLYMDRPLSGGTAKINRRRSSEGEIDHRWSIEGEIDHRQLIKGEKGKKKKKMRRRGYIPPFLAPSSPARCPRLRVILLPRKEMERLPARGERSR